MVRLATLAVILVATAAAISAGLLRQTSKPHSLVQDSVVVVVGSGLPLAAPTRSVAPSIRTKDDGPPVAQYASPSVSSAESEGIEGYDWENSATATRGFSDRTGPPTLPGGGFSASPDDKPLEGDVLEIP